MARPARRRQALRAARPGPPRPRPTPAGAKPAVLSESVLAGGQSDNHAPGGPCRTARTRQRPERSPANMPSKSVPSESVRTQSDSV